ncbi:hypothetical protein [Actinoplanes sp. NPDC048796]|uniref:Imm32 family immunity protein n=1 Tax=unclassified Actinoplanes TaxID=2626549 RepID=UPI0033CCF553
MQVLRSDATLEMELRGTVAELEGLAELVCSGSGTAELDRIGDPAPYDRTLARITVEQTSGPALIGCFTSPDVLDIRGGHEQLGLIADEVRGVAEDGDPRSHLHIDHYPGHGYLDESSEPLVVTLRQRP